MPRTGGVDVRDERSFVASAGDTVQDRPGGAEPRVQIGRRSAATSPSVLSPHRPNVDRCSESPNTERTSTGSVRHRGALLPRGTTSTGHAPASPRLRPGSRSDLLLLCSSRRPPAPSSLAAVPVAATQRGIDSRACAPRAPARARRRRIADDPVETRNVEKTASPRRSTRGEKHARRRATLGRRRTAAYETSKQTARAAAVGGRRSIRARRSFPPRTDADSSATVTPPGLRARCSAATTRAAVRRPSTARANRNQVVNGSRRRADGGTSATSSAATANPPACSTRLNRLHGAFERRNGIDGRLDAAGLTAHPEDPLEASHGFRPTGNRRQPPTRDRNGRTYRRAPPALRSRRRRISD